MPRPLFAPLAASLPETVPFVGPEALERLMGHQFRARLGANESPFGCSTLASKAMMDALGSGWRYGDPECHDLRQAVSKHHGISFDEVVIGEGIDALLGLAVRLFAAPGAAVVTSLGGYPTLNYHVTGFGARLVATPYSGSHEDITALAAAARRENAAIVYLANPDNPMGSWWPSADISAFIEAVPETTLILLDEAYGEFAPAGTLPAIDTTRPNVLRLRTFSKAYGMAGLRCGYAIGERQTIRAFERVRNHFGVNAIAQAGAIAALGDAGHLATVLARTIDARSRIAEIAIVNGLAPLPSATNFVAIDTGRDGPFALTLLERLADLGVFIRKPSAPGLDRCIRISVGDAAALKVLADALPQAIAAAG